MSRGTTGTDPVVVRELRKSEAALLTVTTLLSPTRQSSQYLVSLTPSVCVAVDGRVLMIHAGLCKVEFRDSDTNEVLRTWSHLVVELRGDVVPMQPIRFSRMTANLTSSLRSIVESAAGAKEIIVVGHSAGLTGMNRWNDLISQARAEAVRNRLLRMGVRIPVRAIGLGAAAPLTRVMTEEAQQANRRVAVYVVPSKPLTAGR